MAQVIACVQLAVQKEYFSDKALLFFVYFGVGGRQEPCPLNPLQVVWVTGASAGFGEALCVALCQADAWQVLEGSALPVKWSRSKGKTWGTYPERSPQG